MFRTVSDSLWAFDIEWVPDSLAGKLLYALPSITDERSVFEVMWKNGGATEEDPTPYLKTALCKIVSLSALIRTVKNNEVTLSLRSLPNKEHPHEPQIIETFLNAVGKTKPQLVGFNSAEADLRILIQRALVHGIVAKDFCTRPDKPWSEGADYFGKSNEQNIDLKQILCGWGKSGHSLHEIAVLSGIPGKFETSGDEVWKLYLAGELEKIIQYNEFDAITTYLVWLRLANFGGHFSAEQYQAEQQRVEHLLLQEITKGKIHLGKYLEEWKRLKSLLPAA
jgi:predicted PolB exonuclease-like 3'-5' exonuclease